MAFETALFLTSIWLSVFNLQSISAPGSGIWSDGKDKSDGAQAHTWNVEVLIDVLKELVSFVSILVFYAEYLRGACLSVNIKFFKLLAAWMALNLIKVIMLLYLHDWYFFPQEQKYFEELCKIKAA